MNAVLVKSSGDWGDEFDLEGFALFPSKESWEEYCDNIPDGDVECYFGSNEFVTFEGKDDYLGYLKVDEITENALEVILRVFFNKTVEKFRADNYHLTYGLFIENQE